MKKPLWLDKLEKKWNVTTWQAIIILIVFACTGTTVLFLKEPVLSLIGPEEDRSTWFTVLYYILIFPIYNVILLIYGFLFGQFSFFWEFEKKTFRRMFRRKS